MLSITRFFILLLPTDTDQQVQLNNQQQPSRIVEDDLAL